MTPLRGYTAAELRQFDRLTEQLSSRNQLDRIHARLELPKFIKKYGKEKCDTMFAALKLRDGKKSKCPAR
jgi:hypothetical protein